MPNPTTAMSLPDRDGSRANQGQGFDEDKPGNRRTRGAERAPDAELARAIERACRHQAGHVQRTNRDQDDDRYEHGTEERTGAAAEPVRKSRDSRLIKRPLPAPVGVGPTFGF